MSKYSATTGVMSDHGRKIYTPYQAFKVRSFSLTTSAERVRLKISAVMLACLLSVGLISRYLLINNSLRLDEAQSLWQTSHSVRGTLKVVAEDVHVPLYHLILHFWQFYIGPGVINARLLSLIFFMATIPIVYLLARRILSVNWSLIVMTLFSLSPFMNWYANEARMYTLLVLMASISQYYFIRILESKGRSGWYGYTLSAIIGIFSHYFFAFNLMAQAVYFLLNRRGFVKGTFRRFVLVAVAVAAVLTPWLYYFMSLGSASNTRPNLANPSSVDFFNVFSNFSFGFQNDVTNTILVSTWPILVIVSLLAVKRGQRINLTIGYILTAGFLPILLAFGLSYLTIPFFLSRYMVACVAPLLIIVVWFVSHYGKRLAYAVAAIFFATTIATSVQQYTSAATPVKEDFRSAAEYIDAHATARDVVALSAPFTVYPFTYYYQGPASVTTIPTWNRYEPGPAPGFDAQKLPQQIKETVENNHRYAYVVLSYNQGYENNIFQYFEQHYPRLEYQQFSNDVKLYKYQVGYNQVPTLDELAAQPIR